MPPIQYLTVLAGISGAVGAVLVAAAFFVHRAATARSESVREKIGAEKTEYPQIADILDRFEGEDRLEALTKLLDGDAKRAKQIIDATHTVDVENFAAGQRSSKESTLFITGIVLFAFAALAVVGRIAADDECREELESCRAEASQCRSSLSHAPSRTRQRDIERCVDSLERFDTASRKSIGDKEDLRKAVRSLMDRCSVLNELDRVPAAK